jgi:hypothetical protein
MDRLEKYLVILLVIYAMCTFVAAEFNPMAWHWSGRLFLVSFWVLVTVAFDLLFPTKRK